MLKIKSENDNISKAVIHLEILAFLSGSYPVRQLVRLVVFPHFLQHLIDGVVVWHFSVKVDSHQVGHSVKQAGDLQKLLSGVFEAVRPGVVDKKNALKTKTGR